MIARSLPKKISLGFAVACVFGMTASLATFIYFLSSKGAQDVLSASAMATSFFFASCAVVLYFMSMPPRYELRPWDEEEGR